MSVIPLDSTFSISTALSALSDVGDWIISNSLFSSLILIAVGGILVSTFLGVFFRSR